MLSMFCKAIRVTIFRIFSLLLYLSVHNSYCNYRRRLFVFERLALPDASRAHQCSAYKQQSVTLHVAKRRTRGEMVLREGIYICNIFLL